MVSDYSDPNERRPRPMRTAMIVAGLAFLAGLGLMAWALTQWEPGRKLVRRETSPATDLVAAQSGLPEPTSPASAPKPATAPLVTQPVPPAMAIPDQGRIAEIEARMARIDVRAAAAAGHAARAEGLLIAFAARRALDRGVPLGYLEGELRERFGSEKPREVGIIISAAQSPITLESLSSSLDMLEPKLVGAGADESWWDATKRTLGGLIVVRREGAGSPAPDQRLERATLRLSAGEVENAMTEVARLPGRAAAQTWLDQARRYVEAHRALDVLEAAALTQGRAPNAAPASDAALATPIQPKENQ